MQEQDWGLVEALLLQMEKIADRIAQLNASVTIDESCPVVYSTELV